MKHLEKNKVAELDILTDYLKSILENISQGIIFIDLRGIITTCNRSAENILAIDSRKILFHSYWEYFQDDAFGFSMKEALAAKKFTAPASISYTTPGNVNLDLEVAATFLPPRTDAIAAAPQGMILMIRDVTEVHHLQTLANRADRMKELGEMAAHLAHEIRNPLGGIKGFASLLQRDLYDRPPLEQMASYIVEGTNNLNNLVTQVLDYARPVQPHLEKVDLAALLHEARNLVLADENLDTRNIDIAIDAPAEKIIASLDPLLFQSALLNLIVNAIQAMPSGGKIVLSVLHKRTHAILKIADTGIGIPQENINKIFSPFFTTKEAGNGLGLSEVQKVVQAHGGTIDVTSTVGSGTTFIIKIPLITSINQSAN